MGFLATVVSIIQPILGVLYSLPVIGYYLDLWSLLLTASFARFGSGHIVANNVKQCRRPNKLLKLYEYEGCPFCRKVREALCVLDLDAIIYPCPRETFASYGFVKDSRYRPEAKKLGGKCQFPLLVDENEEQPVILYESDKIVKYLWTKYGDKATATPTYQLGSTKFSFFFMMLASCLRCFPEHGLIRIPSKKPSKLLVLYGFEPSPFCKKVREILACLEIPYISRNISRGSSKRKEFAQKYGDQISQWRKSAKLICVPFLIDPNTGVEMFESEDIKQYLIKTYKTGEVAVEGSVADCLMARKPKSQSKKET